MKRVVAPLLARSARMLAGASIHGHLPVDSRQRIYFANHTSHLDFVVIWSALPSPVRALTRPVAAKDYWGKGAIRRYLAVEIFNAVLLERRQESREQDPIDTLDEGLGDRHSLIVFPEGTRGSNPDPAAFKSGIYRLAQRRPGVDLVPVLIDNLNRILPKGEIAPVPMLSHVAFGDPIRVGEGEEKQPFLDRARQAILELRQW